MPIILIGLGNSQNHLTQLSPHSVISVAQSPGKITFLLWQLQVFIKKGLFGAGGVRILHSYNGQENWTAQLMS
jgi:hypothetical protein